MFGLSELAIKIIGLCLAVAVVLGGVYFKGRHDVQVKFDQYKAEVTRVAEEQKVKIAAEVKTRTNITKKAEVTREKSTASIRSTYSALRMRNAASGGPVPKIPDAAADPDGAANHYISVAPELAEQCAQTTQQLIELQSWVTEQAEVE